LPFETWIKRLEIDFLRSGKNVSRCMMIVACVDKKTMRPMDWQPDVMAMFFEKPTD